MHVLNGISQELRVKVETGNSIKCFPPFISISQESCLLFLKLLDNSKKAKQGKRGEAVLNMDWQGWLKDKTNQDCLGKRVCTESRYSAYPTKGEQEDHEFMMTADAEPQEVLTVSAQVSLSAGGMIIIIKANIDKLLIK